MRRVWSWRGLRWGWGRSRPGQGAWKRSATLCRCADRLDCTASGGRARPAGDRQAAAGSRRGPRRQDDCKRLQWRPTSPRCAQARRHSRMAHDTPALRAQWLLPRPGTRGHGVVLQDAHCGRSRPTCLPPSCTAGRCFAPSLSRCAWPPGGGAPAARARRRPARQRHGEITAELKTDSRCVSSAPRFGDGSRGQRSARSSSEKQQHRASYSSSHVSFPLVSQHGQTAVAVCQGEACRRLMADSERLQRWHRRKQLATWRVGGV